MTTLTSKAVRFTTAAALGLGLLWSAPSRGAPPNTIANSVAVCDPWNPQRCATPDTSGNLPVTGTFSATLGGFAPTTTGTPITATTLGVTGTLPAGVVVAAFNVGTTNTAYCKLGASATTSDVAIPPASWFAFTVGAATQLTCITASSTTTVNMVGGSGLPTGAGGGGGGGGGGGAVTMASGAVASGAYSSGSIASGAFASGAVGSGAVASGAVASGAVASGAFAAGALAAGAGSDGWDVTQGAKADAACGTATGTCSQIALLKYLNTVAGSALPAGTAYVGKTRPTDGTNDAVLDPCEANAQTSTPISITTATTTRIVAPTAAKKTYICYVFLTSAAADNIGIVEGTGGTCGTGTAGVIGGTTAANGLNFAANGGVSLTAGGKIAVAVTAGTNVDLCLITSAATPLAGVIKWVQQ